MACSIGSHGEVRRLFKLKPAFVRPIRPVCRNQFVLRSARIIAMKACTVLAGPRRLRRGLRSDVEAELHQFTVMLVGSCEAWRAHPAFPMVTEA